jgi:hypothetical protein
MSRAPGAERPQAGAGQLERISFKTLEVWNIERAGNIKSVELIAIFNVQGRDNRIVYHLYDSKNNVISEGYPRIYNKGEALYPKFFETETPDGIVRMEAYLVDANNHRISNIATKTLYLKKAQPASGIGQRALEDPQFNLPEFPEATTEATITAQSSIAIAQKVQQDIKEAYVSPEEVSQALVTEEVEIEAEPGVTLDSIVSGITQAITVQEAAADPQVLGHTPPPPTLSQEIRKIIDDWSTKKIIVPNWFANNNINWVLQGKISEEEFIAGYTNLLNTGVITIPTAPTPPTPTPPTPTPPPIDTSTSLTMISQKWDYFDIVDGRAKGQITFRATSDFNPYYYGKELVNYMQLVNNQGVTIVLKPNVLRFTQTETDETIQYDEGVGDLKSLKVESYVWTHDNKPMSGLYKFPIYDGKPPGTGTGELARTDFLAKIGGVIAGSLAIALLLPKRIGK